MQITAFGRRTASLLLDFALPPRCPGCSTIVADPHQFCLACWQSIHWLGNPCCDCCGAPLPFEQSPDALCGQCIADPPRCRRVRAAVAYGEVARKVVLKLKYGGKPGIAATLAKYMDRHIPGLGENPLLVPVPLHRWRIWRRGYNQSALIAKALARGRGVDVLLDGFQRRRRTPPLRGMNRQQRKRLVSGAFEVAGAARPLVTGRDLILVDDVYTSGATADACAIALQKAGAASVNLLCWARVVDLDGDHSGSGLSASPGS